MRSLRTVRKEDDRRAVAPAETIVAADFAVNPFGIVRVRPERKHTPIRELKSGHKQSMQCHCQRLRNATSADSPDLAGCKGSWAMSDRCGRRTGQRKRPSRSPSSSQSFAATPSGGSPAAGKPSDTSIQAAAPADLCSTGAG